MRRDFCSFLLTLCPCLRVYGNISYNKQRVDHGNNNHSASDQTQSSEELGTGSFDPADGNRRSTGHRSSSETDYGHHRVIKTCLKGTIVCQPKKGQSVILVPPHISIESPD